MVGAKIKEGTLGKSGQKSLKWVRRRIERIYGYRFPYNGLNSKH
jgi:hypothetical protein